MGAAVVVLVVAMVVMTALIATGALGREPTPEPNFAIDLAPRPCAYEGRDQYEKEFYKAEGWQGPDYERYPGSCQRLRFSYGPILVKPGQNDVLIGPITVEKPDRDGYITRFKPNLVRSDGTVPPVEQVHLHHGTWLSFPSYGSGPFFAAGEEKTIAPFPKGYGLPIHASDSWALLYMVHSAVTQPMETYIIYDIDFVPKDKGDNLGIKPAYPIWLDVRPSGYPVFNVQRRFGGSDGSCTWPKQQCAGFDPWGKKFTGQGEPGNGKGTDWTFPDRGDSLGAIKHFNGGTLIGIGGHLHPGGIQNEIDLVRPGGELVRVKKNAKRRSCVRKRRASKRKKGRSSRKKKRSKCVRKKRRRSAHKKAASARKKRKHAKRRRVTCVRKKKKARRHARRRHARRSTAEAARKHRKHRKGRRHKRRAKCKPGYELKRVDTVRLYTGQAKYWDHADQSRPGGPATSWDFSMPVTGLPRWGVHVQPGDILRSNAKYETKLQASYENMGIAVALIAPDDPKGKPSAPNIDPFQADKDDSDGCQSGGLQAKGGAKLCDKGVVTHGHYSENGNYGGPFGSLPAAPGIPTNQVAISNFRYAPGDLSSLSATGVPEVKLGQMLRFTNTDGAGVYHSVTSCKFPCLGQTGSAFPLANGSTSLGTSVDFDSAQLGLGTPEIGPAKNELGWDLPVNSQEGFKAGDTVTYFCRIHPFMRGAFRVVK